MARLVGSYETSLTTDFAILNVLQEDADGEAITQSYAASTPGCVAMLCGNKYSELTVRLERWDGRPEEIDDSWEDLDVLPWQEVPGAGFVCVSGFDSPTDDGLDVDGVGRARVQVAAIGRHRYGYSDNYFDDSPNAQTREPERWLLRFWPDPDDLDAMAGPPRRIAGDLELDYRLSAWVAAAYAHQRAGWDLPGPLAGLMSGLLQSRGPVSSVELVRLAPAYSRGELSDADPLLTPLRRQVPDDPLARQMAVQLEADLAAVAERVGLPRLESSADGLAGLERLGLIARLTELPGAPIVPNPAPPRADSASEDAAPLPTIDYRWLSFDLAHLVRWSPNAVLESTPERMALRLGLRSQAVVDALRIGFRHGGVDLTQPDPADRGTIRADTSVRLVLKGT